MTERARALLVPACPAPLDQAHVSLSRTVADIPRPGRHVLAHMLRDRYLDWRGRLEVDVALLDGWPYYFDCQFLKINDHPGQFRLWPCRLTAPAYATVLIPWHLADGRSDALQPEHRQPETTEPEGQEAQT